ncbi:MAG: glycosyltransferase family 2 protein [Candidatus Aminicenantes bacterium]|nr:glycosyltransferase family 2 protein [Candidatus Aminicenantes bacterium]
MKKVSVVIITLNEEDRLEGALKSCRDIADEIVVVDSFSTDKTCEIAARYGAVIYKNVFSDYGSQKNIALEKASHEWILNLDADERVSDRLKNEILAFKQKQDSEAGEDDADGFLINRKTFYLGRWIKHSGWYPDCKLRFFRKSKSRWRGRIHEALVLDGKTSRMIGDILHFTYRDITDHIRRLNSYSRLQAMDIVDKKKKLLYLRAFLLPPVTFSRFYFWKLGILDGFPGLVIALVSSWATAMKYLKAIQLKRKAGGKENLF